MLRLNLVEGKPDGLRIVEIANMTILAIFFPRTQLDKFASLPSSQKPGVYLLLGNDLEDPEQLVLYVGEGEQVLPRLIIHSSRKDFWTDTIVFTSIDKHLTKTEIEFLEAEIYQLAKEAFQVKLDNTVAPTKPLISEFDKAATTQFLEGIKLVLLSLGLSFLEPQTITIPGRGTDIIYELIYKTAAAKMIIQENDYIVLKDSTAIVEERFEPGSAINKLRQKLKDAGIMAENGTGLYIFTQNVKFHSPSQAATTIVGGAANGRMLWKYKDKSIKQLELENSMAGG